MGEQLSPFERRVRRAVSGTSAHTQSAPCVSFAIGFAFVPALQSTELLTHTQFSSVHVQPTKCVWRRLCCLLATLNCQCSAECKSAWALHWPLLVQSRPTTASKLHRFFVPVKRLCFAGRLSFAFANVIVVVVVVVWSFHSSRASNSRAPLFAGGNNC